MCVAYRKDGGRDDDRYRQEFGWAVNALQRKLEPLRRIAADLNNCPKNEEGVNAARRHEAEFAKLREENARLKRDNERRSLLFFNKIIASRVKGDK